MKKKSLIVLIVFGILGIFSFIYLSFNNKDDFKNEESNILKGIKVLGYNLDNEFKTDKKKYTLEVSEDKVYVLCNSSVRLAGCNESIYLGNEEYTHEVIIDDAEKYEITFKKKVDNENFRILSIDGVPLEINGKAATIVVKAIGEGLSYSFDGGVTWQESNQIVVTEDTELQVVIKDINGNLSEVRIIPVNITNEFSGFLRAGINSAAATSKVTSSIGKTNITSSSASSATSIGSNSAAVIGNNSNTVATNPYSLTSTGIKFEANGATSIGKNFISCSGTCDVVLPSITRPSGKVIGWNTKKDGSGTKYLANNRAKLSKGTVLYAQTERIVVVRFYRNGADSISGSIASYVDRTCTYKNEENGCYITTPTIKKSGSEALGWSDIANGEEILFKQSERRRIVANKSYYAIYQKGNGKLTITLSKGTVDVTENSKKMECKTDSSGCCVIEMPSGLKAKDSKRYSFAGWTRSKSASNPTYAVGDKVPVCKNDIFYAVFKDKKTSNLVATFGQGKTEIAGSAVKVECKADSSGCCTVETPKALKAKDAKRYSLIGWSKNKTANTPTYTPGEKLPICKDEKLYGVYKDKSTTKLVATFRSGVVATTQSSKTEECMADSSGCCTITVPSGLQAKDSSYRFMGWDRTMKSTTATYTVGMKVPICSDQVYYAIHGYMTISYGNTNTNSGTSSTNANAGTNSSSTTANNNSNSKYTVTFASGKVSLSGGNITKECYLQRNGKKTCNVEAPKGAANGWNFIGWSTDKNAKTGISSGKSIEVSGNTTYYGIFKKEVVFTFNKGNADKLSNYQEKCTTYGDKCYVKKPPVIYAPGKEIDGYTVNGQLVDIVRYGATVNTTFTVKVMHDQLSSDVNIPKDNIFQVGNIVFEAEKGTNATKLKHFKKRMKEVYNKMPQIFYYPSKVIMFKTSQSLKNYSKHAAQNKIAGYVWWKNSYNYTMVFMHMDNKKESNVSTAIHELSHVFDADMYGVLGQSSRLSKRSNILNMYSKYRNTTYLNKYARDNNEYEFWAETVTIYYYEVLDSVYDIRSNTKQEKVPLYGTDNHKTGSTPLNDELKKMVRDVFNEVPNLYGLK